MRRKAFPGETGRQNFTETRRRKIASRLEGNPKPMAHTGSGLGIWGWEAAGNTFGQELILADLEL